MHDRGGISGCLFVDAGSLGGVHHFEIVMYDMTDGLSYDCISGAKQTVTHVGLLLPGFPCTLNILLNSHRSQNAYCIQQEACDTGKGCKAHMITRAKRKHATRDGETC